MAIADLGNGWIDSLFRKHCIKKIWKLHVLLLEIYNGINKISILIVVVVIIIIVIKANIHDSLFYESWKP